MLQVIAFNEAVTLSILCTTSELSEKLFMIHLLMMIHNLTYFFLKNLSFHLF